MTRPLMGYLAGAAFALCAAGAAAAYAQGAPAPAAAPAPADHGQRIERQVIIRHGDDGGEQRIVRHGHVDPAEHLRTMLQLKPSQEPALAAYIAATRPDHSHEHIVEMSDRDEGKTTPQRLAEMETRMAEQAAKGHPRIEATRKFYDQLEPSQKKVFDQLPMLMIGPMGPMMPFGPMKVMVNMDGDGPMPPLHPAPPMPPRAPLPPHS